MDDKSFTVRVSRKWLRIAMIVGVTTLVVAPLTAIASHSFTDVPNSNTFHADIEWLKNADVTKGCNPPANTLYCPSDNVTRGQMAAFMRRFAKYINAEDGTPAQADNANTLAGSNPSFYERPIAMNTGSIFDGTQAGQNGEIARVTLVAPASGNIIVEHTSSWVESGTYVVVVWAEPFNSGSVCDSRLDGDAIAGTWTVESVESAVDDVASASGAGHVAVSAGTNRYSLCLETFEGTSLNADWSVQAAWYPGGASNVAGASSSGTPSLPDEGVLAP
jgi:hypothetical protein